MKVLIACEESQRVCTAFRERWHEAYSCDIIDQSGGHPEWHIMQDVLPLLDGNCEFETTDGVKHEIDGKWDLIIAHPPCTYLTVTGNLGTDDYMAFSESDIGKTVFLTKEQAEKALQGGAE